MGAKGEPVYVDIEIRQRNTECMAAGWDSWCGSLKHTNSKLCASAGTRRILSDHDHDHDHTPDVPVPVSFVSEVLNPNIVIASF